METNNDINQKTNGFPVIGLNPIKRFFDVEHSNYNPLHWKPRAKSKHEFGIDYEPIIPKEGEVRLLGNRHSQCRYYSLGLELCKQRVIQTNSDTFLSCKGVIDAMYRCYTEDKYGEEYHKSPEVAYPYAKKFFDCYMFKHNALSECMPHFEDSVRAIYRSPDNKIIYYY